MSGPPLGDGLYDLAPGRMADVVTSLEMLSPPTESALGERADLRLRPEPVPRLDWYRALFRRVGTPWLWSGRLGLSDAALSAVLHDPAVAVFAVEADGVDEGLLDLDFRLPGLAEIAYFGLTAALTGRGVGSWLMAQALHHAWSRPITRLWVHTCTLDHPAALPFYRRHGFVPFRRQVCVAPDPRGTGLLPVDAAPRVPLL